jgi:23S rRNA (uracil1939-C5)-methyltransferase
MRAIPQHYRSADFAGWVGGPQLDPHAVRRPQPSKQRPAPGAARPPARAPRAEPRTLRIESIAAGGAGVAHHEGRAVFVPRTAPGDLVEAAVELSGATLRARLLRVIEPGPGRIEPACRFVDACGGCDLMHLSLEAQRAAHRDIVLESLRRIAGASALPEIVTHDLPADRSAAGLAYRTRARLHARAHRGRVEIGYRAPASHDLAPVDRCVILVPELDALLAELPAVLEGAHGTGEISIARGAGGLPVADVAWRGTLPAAVWARLDERVSRGRWSGARAWLEGAATPAAFGDPRPVVSGADGLPLVLAAGGFAQPSGAAAALLARRAAALVGGSGAASEPLAPAAPAPANERSAPIGTLVELFAGSGTLSILLAPLAEKFVAVESHDDSARAARDNLAARGARGKVVTADASEYDLSRADAVVLDPPRTGARGAITRIAASHARSVVYVACDPVTMARDIAVLVAAGFTLTHVETVETFPQTSHVETLVRLVRRGGPPR